MSTLAAPVHALPVDLFRILAGLLGLWYFVRTLRQFADISSPDGLIDHALILRLLPPARLSLFQPGIPAPALVACFAVASVASICVILGVHPRVAAGVVFLIMVSTYRWNIVVAYIDDGIMHLTFFWLLLLPIGSTLSLGDWIAIGPERFDVWSQVTVPGVSTRLFLVNLGIVYVIAGLYKFTSPLWRSGYALHVILKLACARAPNRVGLHHRHVLRLMTWIALVLEPFLALVFVLPPHTAIKWLFCLFVVAFHGGIIGLLRIPFANFAMLGALTIVLGPELMRAGFGVTAPSPLTHTGALTFPDWVAGALVLTLVVMLSWEVLKSGRLSRLPLWKTHLSGFRSNPAYVALWLVGIGQSYRLFDWIDDRNHHFTFEVFERSAGDAAEARRIDPDALFPSGGRHRLLQSYLVGSVWFQFDASALSRLQTSIRERHARRYVRLHGCPGTIEAFATTQRVTADNLDLHRGERHPLFRFSCVDSVVKVDSIDHDVPTKQAQG